MSFWEKAKNAFNEGREKGRFLPKVKTSTWIAGAALFGRSMVKGKRNWKDAALAAVIVKNEVLDKDGHVRKLIEKGSTDGEMASLEHQNEAEMDAQNIADRRALTEIIERRSKQPQQQEKVEPPKGWFGQFMDGFNGNCRRK